MNATWPRCALFALVAIAAMWATSWSEFGYAARVADSLAIPSAWSAVKGDSFMQAAAVVIGIVAVWQCIAFGAAIRRTRRRGN